MNKLKQLKRAIRKTPPERLAKIEYQSHFMHMMGVSVVCGILIWKGFWWIIFAFIFSLGVSYSQWVSAIQKHKGIVTIVGVKRYYPSRDKSFTRRRDYYIKKTLGKNVWILAALLSVYLNLRFVPRGPWWQDIIFSLGFLFFYIVIYFFFFYWLVKIIGEAK